MGYVRGLTISEPTAQDRATLHIPGRSPAELHEMTDALEARSNGNGTFEWAGRSSALSGGPIGFGGSKYECKER